MDLSADRPPTPVAGTMNMMAYTLAADAGVDHKHTTLDSVEQLRQRKRELEEQIHQHTEHLRMPSMLQSHQVRVIYHDDDDDYSASASSASSWGDTNVGGGTTVGPDTTVRPETTLGGATSSSFVQGTSTAPKPKLSSFLKRAEHRVQVSNEVSSVSCSEFGDSYCGEDVSMHDSVSTYLPSRSVMNYLLQQQNSDEDDDDDDDEKEEDWNPNDEADLRHQKKRQERRTSFVSTAPAPKRVVDSSTLGVFVPTIHGTEVVHTTTSSSSGGGDAHHSVTNASAATTTTQHSCSTSEEDIEMAMRRTSYKNKPVTSTVIPNKKTAGDDHDPTLGSTMEDDLTTITKHDKPARSNNRNTKCIMVTTVIMFLLIVVVALLALVGVMLRKSLRHS